MITVHTVSVRFADEMHRIFVRRLFAVRVTHRQDSEQFTREIYGSYGGQWTQSERRHWPGIVRIIVRRRVHDDVKSWIWTPYENYRIKKKIKKPLWNIPLKFPLKNYPAILDGRKYELFINETNGLTPTESL